MFASPKGKLPEPRPEDTNPPAKYAWEELKDQEALHPQSEIFASRLSENYLIVLVAPATTKIKFGFFPNNSPNQPPNQPPQDQKLHFRLLDTNQLKFTEIENATQEPLESICNILEILSEETTIVVSCQTNLSWIIKLSNDYKTILTVKKINYKNFIWPQPGLVVLYKNKLYLQEFNQIPDSQNYQGRLVSLDINTTVTSEHKIPGLVPSAKTKYNIAGYDNKMFLLYGGSHSNFETLDCWALNLDKLTWECLFFQAMTFPKRNGVSCIIGNNIYLFVETPQCSKGKSGELLSYNLENQMWKNIRTSLPESFQLNETRKKQLIPSKDKLFQIDRGQIYYLTLSKIENQENEEVDSNPLYRNLFNDRQFADVEFNINGQIIRAHKAVLSAFSPYYKNMFTSGMMEASSKVIELTDIKVDAFNALLEYIYCNTVSLTEDIVWDLLEQSEITQAPK